MKQHNNYDRAMSAVSLMHSVLSTIFGRDVWIYHLKNFVDGDIEAVPAFVRASANKYGIIALIMDDFFGALQKQSKLTPYPKSRIDSLL